MLNVISGIFSTGVTPSTTAYESIATVDVGVLGSSSISFTSISSSYKHLQVRGIARTTAVDARESIKMTLNSDTGANYARHSLWGSGAATSAFGAASQNYILLTDFAAATATASIFGVAVTDVLDYQNTNKYKGTASSRRVPSCQPESRR